MTASGLKNLVTDKGALRKWTTDMPNSYLHRVLAEKWRGQALESFGGNRQTDQGLLTEDRARKHYASLLEADIETIGGIETDDQRCWCSPDGLIAEAGLEIKCPNADTHIGWLLAGGLPEEHVLQVQFSLWVSGFKQWAFLSYVRDLPDLVIWAGPDPLTFCLIEEAVESFNARMDDAWEKLVELNGGPPPPPPEIPRCDDTDPASHLFEGLAGEHDEPGLIP